jgi:hypothetical protein
MDVTESLGDRVRRMRALTRQAHAGQTRNRDRVPYWVHTDAVADICRDALARTDEVVDAGEDLVLAAYGHDLYEDTSVSRDMVRREFGERVHRWIAELTNERGDADRAEYLRHLAGTEDEVRVVKCADLVDNMLSVAYGLHDLGLPWVRGFFLPIAADTRDVLLATPFRRLPGIGRRMLDLVNWAWRRMIGSMESATGQEWAEDSTVTDSDNRAGSSPEDDEYYEQLRRQRTFPPEQYERIKEELRREEEEWARRVFGDRKPFPFPDTDTDA